MYIYNYTYSNIDTYHCIDHMYHVIHSEKHNLIGSFKATNVLKTTSGTPFSTMFGRAPTEKSPAIQLRQEEVFIPKARCCN